MESTRLSKQQRWNALLDHCARCHHDLHCKDVRCEDPKCVYAKDLYVPKDVRWLVFLKHCVKCRLNEDECSLQTHCKFGKKLWHHMINCADSKCDFPRCTSSKELLTHHQTCKESGCKICIPFKDYDHKQNMAQRQCLLLLKHSMTCRLSEDACSHKSACKTGKLLAHHISRCTKRKCEFRGCMISKDLLKRHRECQGLGCGICAPVRGSTGAPKQS